MCGFANQDSMNSLIALLAPVVLFAPSSGGVDSPAGLVPRDSVEQPGGMPDTAAPVWNSLAEAFRPDDQDQVRIERRVIVRISPRLPLQSEEALADPPRRTEPRRYEERKMGKCVPIKSIAGVQIGQDNRLLLFMRDHGIVSAKLDKSCSARDFYSGFYVESSEDGMICSGRDTLHSRAGSNCELSKLRRLVPADD
jgi:hypothetical protein